MGQLGFFDLNRRYESLTEKNDPLVAIAAMVPFESFRPKLHTALIKGELRRSEAERRNSAGRKPWDEVVIFKALVLQALYNWRQSMQAKRVALSATWDIISPNGARSSRAVNPTR